MAKICTRPWFLSMASTLYFVVALQIIFAKVGFVDGILSQDIGCKPRKVLIPIDAPRYQFFPRFAEVFRCGGACSTLSPNIQQCRAASWNNLTGQIFDLSRVTDPLKEAAFENHTSCQCECVVKAEDCSENEVYKAEQCNCECKFENDPPPCPERFTWSPFQCKCVCGGPVLFCPSRQEWNHDACDCVCTQSAVENCKYENKYLNASTCLCEEQGPQVLVTVPGPPNKDFRGTSKSMDWGSILIAMAVEFIILVVLFDLYLLWRYNKGCIHWIVVKCSRDPKAASGPEGVSLANGNSERADESRNSQQYANNLKTFSKSQESVV